MIDAKQKAKHTPGLYRPHDMEAHTVVVGRPSITIASFDAASLPEEQRAANAQLFIAASDLLAVCSNFEITGPDDDGLIWLVLHGKGLSARGAFNLGKADTLVGKVALFLEEDRRAAIAKAEG